MTFKSVCQQVFCAEAVLGLLSQNFVTWGWDLTYSSIKQRLLDMISRHFGSVASATIRNFSIEKLPLVILVAKLKGNMEIIQVTPHLGCGCTFFWSPQKSYPSKYDCCTITNYGLLYMNLFELACG